jgi:signal transduction histidine kinase
VRDETGITTHYVALKEDITARLEVSRREFELQHRMHRVERMQALGTLAAGVAHDFNNILVAILGFSELGETLLRAGQSPQRVAGYLSEIRTAGERARTLVRQLLAVGRAGPIRLADVDLAALAREVIALVAVSMPQQRIVLTAAEGLPALHADPTQLHQVLMNLLLNARDAMQQDGTARVDIDAVELVDEVTCSACRERFFGPHLQLAVSDDGGGIPEHARERLFESFFTTKDVNQGTGMGLAVVDGIVHRHGGHLLVESPPAGGARFRVLLPLAVDVPDEDLH